MTIRNAAFSAIRWTSMAMIGRAVIAFTQIVTLSRILDPADFRQVAIAVTIVGIGIVFTDMGVSSALIRFRDVTTEDLNSLFWLNICMGALVTLVVAAGSPLIAMFYGDMRLVPLVLVASTVFFVTALGQQQRAMAEKNLRFDVLFRIDMVSAVLGFALAVAAALLGFGAMSIVAGNLLTVGAATLLSWLLLADGWRPAFSFSWRAASRFLAFGANVVAISMFNAIALNGDIILGGRLMPGSSLGYYFQPRDLCMRIMFVVNPIVTRVSFPLLASVSHDRARVGSVYLKAMKMTASVNFPIYAFLAVFGPEVVAIVLGPKWLELGPDHARARHLVRRALGRKSGRQPALRHGRDQAGGLFGPERRRRGLRLRLPRCPVRGPRHPDRPHRALRRSDSGVLGGAGEALLRCRLHRLSPCTAVAGHHHALRRPGRRGHARCRRGKLGTPDRRRCCRCGRLSPRELVHQPRMADVDE